MFNSLEKLSTKISTNFDNCNNLEKLCAGLFMQNTAYEFSAIHNWVCTVLATTKFENKELEKRFIETEQQLFDFCNNFFKSSVHIIKNADKEKVNEKFLLYKLAITYDKHTDEYKQFNDAFIETYYAVPGKDAMGQLLRINECDNDLPFACVYPGVFELTYFTKNDLTPNTNLVEDVIKLNEEPYYILTNCEEVATKALNSLENFLNAKYIKNFNCFNIKEEEIVDNLKKYTSRETFPVLNILKCNRNLLKCANALVNTQNKFYNVVLTKDEVCNHLKELEKETEFKPVLPIEKYTETFNHNLNELPSLALLNYIALNNKFSAKIYLKVEPKNLKTDEPNKVINDCLEKEVQKINAK